MPSDWNFIGQQGNSNSIDNVPYVQVIKFPTYKYYPQYLKIEVLSKTTGVWATKEIKLVDCDGDDPPCDGVGGKPSNGNTNDNPPATFSIYDVTGRLVKSGKIDELTDFRIDNINGIMFCVYYDSEGRYIKTVKLATFNLY